MSFMTGEVEVEISLKLRNEMLASIDAHMAAAKADGDYWYTFSDDWDINISTEPSDMIDEPDYLNVRGYPLIDVGRKHKHIITSVYTQLIGGD